jgi:hypothetical protein
MAIATTVSPHEWRKLVRLQQLSGKLLPDGWQSVDAA